MIYNNNNKNYLQGKSLQKLRDGKRRMMNKNKKRQYSCKRYIFNKW